MLLFTGTAPGCARRRVRQALLCAEAIPQKGFQVWPGVNFR